MNRSLIVRRIGVVPAFAGSLAVCGGSGVMREAPQLLSLPSTAT
jgi:hypothetical protein